MSQGRFSSSMVSAPAVTCMKTLMMIFNFVFWVTGIAILAIGIWTKVQLYIYMELSSIYYKEAPFILIGVGAVIVLVGSLGCCCTVKGHSRLLYLYAFFLIIVFVVELGSGIAGFIYKKKLQTGFREGLNGAKNDYGQPKQDKRTEAVDDLQHELECCGVENYTDWFTTNWGKEHPRSVPKSCCKGDHAKCQNTNVPMTPTNATHAEIYTEGCYNKVVDFMDSNMGIIGGVALGISFFQLFGAMLACFLAKHINKAKYEQVA